MSSQGNHFFYIFSVQLLDDKTGRDIQSVQIKNYNIMKSKRYQTQQQHQLKAKLPSKTAKAQAERLKTSPSFFASTFETQDSNMEIDRRYPILPHQLVSNHSFNQYQNEALWACSQIKTNRSMENEIIADFLAQLKFIAFTSNQNKQNKNYIVQKQKNLAQVKLQINQKQEQLKVQNNRYAKKAQQLANAKLRKILQKQKKNQQVALSLQKLNIQINRMKTKLKHGKIKKKQIISSLPIQSQSKHNCFLSHYYYPFPVYQAYYPPNCYPLPYPVPYLATHHPIQRHRRQHTDYQRLIHYNHADFVGYQAEKFKFRTEATYESKPSEEPLTGNKRRRMMSVGGQTSRKSQQISQMRNKSHQKLMPYDLTKMKKNIRQKQAESPKKSKLNNPQLKKFLSEHQQEIQDKNNYITLTRQKQKRNLNQSPIKNLKHQSSQCNTYKMHLHSQNSQWRSLIEESRALPEKTNIQAISKNLGPDFMKFLSDNEKHSEHGSNTSIVSLSIASNKRKKTIQGSDKYKNPIKMPFQQSKIEIQYSGIDQSTVSKRQRTKSGFGCLIGRQPKRNEPLQLKECIRISEQNQENASLKTTHNSLGGLINNSQNQRQVLSNNSNNSKKHKHISIIQQQQERQSPLKNSASSKVAEKKQYSQSNGLSKFQLKTHSKNMKKLANMHSSKDEEDPLAQIHLVGQSKISKSKQSSQCKPLGVQKNEANMRERKISKLRQQNDYQGPQLDHFNFVLTGQSNIKRFKQKPNRVSEVSSPSKKSEQAQMQGLTSFELQLNQNSIDLKESYSHHQKAKLKK